MYVSHYWHFSHMRRMDSWWLYTLRACAKGKVISHDVVVMSTKTIDITDYINRIGNYSCE